VRVHPNYQDDDPYIEKVRSKFPDYAYFSSDDNYFKIHPEQIDNWTYSMKRASLEASTNESHLDWLEEKYDLAAF